MKTSEKYSTAFGVSVTIGAVLLITLVPAGLTWGWAGNAALTWYWLIALCVVAAGLTLLMGLGAEEVERAENMKGPR